MSTGTEHRRPDGSTSSAPASNGRPPLVAMVVVAVVMVGTVIALFRAGGDVTETLLDEGEVSQPAGQATFDLGSVTVTGQLDHEWIRRERCPGWIQLNSMDGDATTVHLVTTTVAPDAELGRLEPVEDLPAWWADSIGVDVADPQDTTLLDTPATSGELRAADAAPEQALLVACQEPDGGAGVGIKGPAAGFRQFAVASTEPVDGMGTVLVLGAAWVGGDAELARDEAAGLAASLTRAGE